MCPARALPPEALCRLCDPSTVPFETTSSAAAADDFLGQHDAIAAADFGVAVRHEGYNLFVVGPPGVGKQSLIQKLLLGKAQSELPTEDYCYVYNFDAPRRPRSRLRAGRRRG